MHLIKDDSGAKETPDRPAIEITEEMISAGACVFRVWAEESFSYGNRSAERAAVEVFEAMIRACRAPK